MIDKKQTQCNLMRTCFPPDTTRLQFMLYLQISDDGVLHVLLLFLQEVETHSIQRVRAQLVVSEKNLTEAQQSGCSRSAMSYLSNVSCAKR